MDNGRALGRPWFIPHSALKAERSAHSLNNSTAFMVVASIVQGCRSYFNSFRGMHAAIIDNLFEEPRAVLHSSLMSSQVGQRYTASIMQSWCPTAATRNNRFSMPIRCLIYRCHHWETVTSATARLSSAGEAVALYATVCIKDSNEISITVYFTSCSRPIHATGHQSSILILQFSSFCDNVQNGIKCVSKGNYSFPLMISIVLVL